MWNSNEESISFADRIVHFPTFVGGTPHSLYPQIQLLVSGHTTVYAAIDVYTALQVHAHSDPRSGLQHHQCNWLYIRVSSS